MVSKDNNCPLVSLTALGRVDHRLSDDWPKACGASSHLRAATFLIQFIYNSRDTCVSTDMSQRTFQLPLRTLARSRPNAASTRWVCCRCLATQVEQPSPNSNTIPLNADQASQRRTPKSASKAESYDPKVPYAQRDYSLSKSDYYLKRPLPQAIPPQYLQHSTSDLLHFTERAQREKVSPPHKPLVGVVVSAGKMDKTVKVRIPRMEWNGRIKKV